MYSLKGDADRALNYVGESLGPRRAINTLRGKSDPDFENLRDEVRFREPHRRVR